MGIIESLTRPRLVHTMAMAERAIAWLLRPFVWLTKTVFIVLFIALLALLKLATFLLLVAIALVLAYGGWSLTATYTNTVFASAALVAAVIAWVGFLLHSNRRAH
jgi:hypothetical protein